MAYEDEMNQSSGNKYECLLFDLDDTLYPLSSGLSAHVIKNIGHYMVNKLGIEESKVSELCLSLYKYYGTTMAGLKAIGYKLEYDDFHAFVHGTLPYDLLKPDHVLRNLLLSVPLRKVIFTNADKNHASSILSKLGLEDCFETIICFETLNDCTKGMDTVDVGKHGVFDINEYTACPNSGVELPKSPVVCKPFEDAYEQVFKIASINPQKTLFFDDGIRNIQTGKRLGLHTVWVGQSYRTEVVDHVLESIHNIKEAIPELWEDNEKSECIEYPREVTIEESVKA